ncbi:MAG: FAD-dependent monooxygenase [Rickettsiella sp.]|nr:FAD-dependent monooxygenase [Rickettsiella sp.]
MNQDCDILIIGAGIVGVSLVLALSHLPLRIALIEQVPINYSTDSIVTTESKPIALNYGSIRLLQSLLPGIDLLAYANPIKSVHISKQACFAAARINAKEMGVSALGYVVPAAQLGLVLTKALLHLTKVSKLINFTIFNPAQCQALLKTRQGWEALVTTKKGELQTVSARLVIAADGSNSIVRKLLDIGIKEQKEGQMALVTTIKLTRHHCHRAYQRFTDQGVLAFLPLLENKVGLVWTGGQLIKALQSLTESDFLARLQLLFGYRLGRFLERGASTIYPIKSFIAESQVQPGLILLGNAAHTLSPIAAQGLNLALQDMAELVDVLTKSFAAKKDLVDPCIGQTYLTARLDIQEQLLKFTENLGGLFKETFGPLTLIRNSGLLAFDLVFPLKRNLSRRLMGIHGRLPPLVRGVGYQQEKEYVEI